MDLISAGRALLLREYPHAKPHLWFILTDPYGDPPEVVAVMLRTARTFTDETVLLQPGDHPFVKHESSVHYSTARFFKVSAITRAVETGQCHLQTDSTPELLARLRNGLLTSPYTVNAIREYCSERF